MQDEIDALADGYLRGFHLATRVSLDFRQEVALQSLSTAEIGQLRSAAKQCLDGFFLLRPYLRPATRDELDKHIQGAIFPVCNSWKYTLLVPLFELPRALISYMQQAVPGRPLKSVPSTSKLNNNTRSTSTPTSAGSSSTVERTNYNEIAEELDALLSTFVSHLSAVEQLLMGSRTDGVNQQDEADNEDSRYRASRVSSEAQVMRCNLAMTMASGEMATVKARARARYRVDDGEVVEVSSDEDDDDGDGNDNKETKRKGKKFMSNRGRNLTERVETSKTGIKEEQSEDVKPATHVGQHPNSDKLNKPGEEDAGVHGVRWEEVVDSALLQALEVARDLTESGQADVLAARIHLSDWFSDDSVPTSPRAVASPDVVNQVESSTSNTNCSYDDTTCDASYSSASESQPGSESGLEHPDARQPSKTGHRSTTTSSPLRSLFPLYDRYEELRLAVWLVLPHAKRGKMGAFMRGVDPPLPSPAAGRSVSAEPSVMSGEELVVTRSVRGEESGEQGAGGGKAGMKSVGEAWDELGMMLMLSYAR